MRTEHPTKCVVPLQKLRVRSGSYNQFMPPPPSYSLLTVPRWFPVACIGVRVSVTLHLMFVHNISSWV